MKALLNTLLVSTSAMAALFSSAAFADPITMSATYYTITEGDQDMNHLAGGVFNNEVQQNLGPNGLPILNTTQYGCTSNCFSSSNAPQDVTSNGQITWWSPSLNTDVTQTGTGTVTTPYNNGSFYPTNGGGGNDASGFQAAVFSTVLNVPTAEAISFNVGADDVAFVYLNDQIVCDLGGVHGDSAGTCTSGVLSAGSNTLEIFYADLEQTGAALTFSVETSGITGAPPPPAGAPEPANLALFALGLGAMSYMVRRRGSIN
jgi:fibro-slime domain-containing protein